MEEKIAEYAKQNLSPQSRRQLKFKLEKRKQFYQLITSAAAATLISGACLLSTPVVPIVETGYLFNSGSAQLVNAEKTETGYNLDLGRDTISFTQEELAEKHLEPDRMSFIPVDDSGEKTIAVTPTGDPNILKEGVSGLGILGLVTFPITIIRLLSKTKKITNEIEETLLDSEQSQNTRRH